MKIDITPNELKSIITAYKKELTELNIRYSELEEGYSKLNEGHYGIITYMKMREENQKKRIKVSKRMFKIEPRMKCLRKLYKDLLNGVRTSDFVEGCNGVRNYCKLNDLSEEDVAELLDELESQGRI